MSASSAGLLALAERCEQATGPDRELDEAIRVELGLEKVLLGFGPGLYPDEEDYEASLFTASLDAAMTLAAEGISAPDVLRHAITQCSRYGAPTFIEALPRFVAAQWLRARASQEHQQ
jgi:hypothetical protein